MAKSENIRVNKALANEIERRRRQYAEATGDNISTPEFTSMITPIFPKVIIHRKKKRVFLV